MSNVKTIIQMKRFSCFAIFQIGFFLSLIGVLVVKYTEQLKLSTYQVSLYLSMNCVENCDEWRLAFFDEMTYICKKKKSYGLYKEQTDYP